MTGIYPTPAVAETGYSPWLSVASVAFRICLFVCLCDRALKGKRFTLSIPKSVSYVVHCYSEVCVGLHVGRTAHVSSSSTLVIQSLTDSYRTVHGRGRSALRLHDVNVRLPY